jgi:type I restriction enzyme S subunit
LKSPNKGAFAMGPFGSRIKAENFVAEGVPVIKGGNLNGDFLNETTFDYLTAEKASELSTSIARKGDIVVTHRGTLGQVGIIPDNSGYSEYIVSQSQLKLSFDTKRVNPYFIYYFLRSSLGQRRLLANTSQVGVPAIAQALTTMRGIKVPLPNLITQNQIVGALRILDDRITLLRETNATLEAIAQALFKSWFVDFDPVHAKRHGRAPEGMDEATAALFPDSFEESELGLVPKGWRVGTLGDIAQTTKRQLQASELNTELNYVGLEHIPRKSLSLSNWGNAEGLESAKASFVEGDILFGKLRPYFHKVVIAPFDGVCSTDILVCQSTEEAYYGVTAMYLFSVPLIDYADRLSNGAKMPRVNWKDLAAYPICVPPLVLAAIFSKTINPLITRMMANTHQAQALANLRDTLLPRLISGQLRLPETDDQFKESAL